MDLTVADLKVGSRLFFGKYGVSHTPQPVSWLKADKDGNFLSEFAVDYLMFDAKEPNNPDRTMYYCGNCDYSLSNIHQFLNSDEDDWYEPSHEYDYPPGRDRNNYQVSGMYLEHSGFLSDFEEYEIASLNGNVVLPTRAQLFGGGGIPRFELFRRKGLRAKASEDLIYGKPGYSFEENNYIEFWMQDAESHGGYAYIVNRGGKITTRSASLASGIRPVCNIKPDTKVEVLSDGVSYRVVPFDATSRRKSCICTDDELMAFLGLQ